MLVAVIVAGSLMAVVYIWRIVELTYFRRLPSRSIISIKEAPPALLATTWVAALANIYFGLVPTVPVSLSTSAATALLGHVQ